VTKPPQARLSVRDSLGHRVIVIDKSPFRIGRRPDSDLILNGAEVSRDHAEIVLAGDRYVIKDRQSKYGTYVNIARVIEQPENLWARDPPIRAIYVYNSNPAAVAPDSSRVIAGFSRDDLFCVVHEIFKTDTADYADILLPATTQLEQTDVHSSYGHLYAVANNPAIAPIAEALPNTEVFRRLASRMGFDDPCFADDDETLARIAFRPATAGGVDFGELRAQGWVKLKIAEAPFAEGGFPTASGKARVDVPGLGVPDHVANYESATSTPDLARRFPLAMISPPARNFLNSSFVNVTSLRAIEGEPVLEISASDAAARGIVDGQRVRIFNDRGSIVCKAVVGERARPGVVNGMGVWWKKLAPDGKNGNELTHQRLTDIGRAPSFYDCLVEVEAAAVSAAA